MSKFKRGDFITNLYFGGTCILDFVDQQNNGVRYFAFTNGYILKTGNGYVCGYIDDFRLATDTEKQILLDKLHENGKKWDSFNFKIKNKSCLVNLFRQLIKLIKTKS